MVEVYTYWRGDLIDVTRVPAPIAEMMRAGSGVLEHVVNDRPRPPEHLVAANPEWGFWRILSIVGICYVVLMIGLSITPDPDVVYWLDEPLGSLKLAPAGSGGDPYGFGKLYAARPQLPGSYEPKPARTGPLIPSPPGSRTYQAPPMPEPIKVAGTLALLRTSGRSAGVLGALRGTESAVFDVISEVGSDSAYGSGGLGLRGGVVGGVVDRRPVAAIVGRGGGGTAEGIVGLGTIDRGAPLDTSADDKVYRRTTCREVIRIVREAADELEEPLADPPAYSDLYRTCRYRAKRSSMTCVTKAADADADREELIERCGEELPPIFREALGLEDA